MNNIMFCYSSMKYFWICTGLFASMVVFNVFTDVANASEIKSSVNTVDLETIAWGKSIYAQHCASCHGENLEGQPNWQQKLPNGRMPAPPHDETGHTWHHPDSLLFGMVKKGTAAYAWKGYESDMPAFGNVLSDEEIWAVIVYIKSNWPKKIQDGQSKLTERKKEKN